MFPRFFPNISNFHPSFYLFVNKNNYANQPYIYIVSNNIINIKNLPIDLNDNKYKHDAYDVQPDFTNDLLDNTIPVSLQHLGIKLKNKYDWYQYNHQLLNNKDQKFLKQLIQK